MSAAAVLNEDDSRRRLGMVDYPKMAKPRGFSPGTVALFSKCSYTLSLPTFPRVQRKQEPCQHFGWRKWGTAMDASCPDLQWTALLSCQAAEARSACANSSWEKPRRGLGTVTVPLPAAENILLCLPTIEKIGHFLSPWPVKSSLPDQTALTGVQS